MIAVHRWEYVISALTHKAENWKMRSENFQTDFTKFQSWLKYD